MLKRALLTCCLLLISLAGPGALAETIAVIGTGNVGMALGTQFAEQGHTIIYGSRTPGGEKAQALVAKTVGDATAMLPADAAAVYPGPLVLGVGLLAAEGEAGSRRTTLRIRPQQIVVATGGSFRFPIQPFEIKSFRVRFAT